MRCNNCGWDNPKGIDNCEKCGYTIIANNHKHSITIPGISHGKSNGSPNGYTRIVQTNAEPPVVGFLYSVSKRGITEYWPLHIGGNTIGQSNGNDIVLHENTMHSLATSGRTRRKPNDYSMLWSTIIFPITCD